MPKAWLGINGGKVGETRSDPAHREEAGPIRTTAPLTVYLTTAENGPIVGLQPRELTRSSSAT
jgi:hypothetical protein